MSAALLTDQKIAGGVLAAPILIGVFALAFMIVTGGAGGYGPAIRGDLERMAPYAGTLDGSILLFILAWVVHLLGAGLLARLLVRAGADQIAVLAFILITVTVFSAILKFSFDMTAEPWAAQETARAGTLPALYEPLSTWMSSVFRIGYAVHFAAVIGIGWGVVQSGLLSRSLGWATILWSALWLAGALAGVGIPALPFLMPAVLGLALIAK